MNKSTEQCLPSAETPATEPGHIRFYGIFWKKDEIDWNRQQLLGEPVGWFGKGRTKDAEDKKKMNFWKQKGIYILYDQNFNVIYAGQAGLERNSESNGRNIGERISEHGKSYYKHAWIYFSWFGFLSTNKIPLRTAIENDRLNPTWNFRTSNSSDLNSLLNSFEAIIVEGFQPRFNARGGNLKDAISVKQISALKQST